MQKAPCGLVINMQKATRPGHKHTEKERPHMRKTRAFLSFLTTAFLSLSAALCPLVLSCNGNGGTGDMDGDTYTPGGVGGGVLPK